MKKVIIILGLPGSGKSTLSKLISEHMDYSHVEFDITSKYTKECDHIIFDSWNETTEDIDATLNQFDGYEKTIIFLNTEKSICLENIKKRGRSTVDITNIEINYDFKQLDDHLFDLIQINNYKLDTDNSVCNIDTLLFNKLIDIIKSGKTKI